MHVFGMHLSYGGRFAKAREFSAQFA
jgi:hypothetical protein